MGENRDHHSYVLKSGFVVRFRVGIKGEGAFIHYVVHILSSIVQTLHNLLWLTSSCICACMMQDVVGVWTRELLYLSQRITGPSLSARSIQCMSRGWQCAQTDAANITATCCIFIKSVLKDEVII
jgi:hypothetical protein